MDVRSLADRIRPIALILSPMALSAIAVALLYYPAIKLGMVWDDHITFQGVPVYTDPAFIVDAIRNPLIYFANYYRPLVVVSFLIQTYFFGVDPRVFHTTSIVLHAANAVLVTTIALRLAPALAPNRNRILLAGFAGLLYALHPVLIEPVSFLSSRFDLLLTFFLLLALLADVSLKHPLLRAPAVGVAFLLAALCKEMALGLPLALPLWHLAREPRPILPLRSYLHSIHRRGDLYVYISVFLGGLVYLALRHLAIGYILDPNASGSPLAMSTTTHALLVAYSLTKYLSLIFLPFGQIAPAHPLPFPLASTNASLWLLLAFLVAILALMTYLMHRRVAGAYLFAAALLSLFPISNVFPLWRPHGGYFAESYLVFPAAMFVFAAVFLLSGFLRWLSDRDTPFVKRGAFAIVVIWFAASILTIRATVPLWSSDLSLWNWAAREEPRSTLAADNLAVAYLVAGKDANAYAEAVRAIQLPGATLSDKSITWYIMSVLAFNSHHVKTAIRMANLAVKHGPALSEIPTMRAHYLNADGQYKEAAEQARATLAELPRSFAHTQLGIALLGLGKYEEAVRELRIGANTATDPGRKRLAEKNLKIAQEAIKRKSRGLKVHAKPVVY